VSDSEDNFYYSRGTPRTNEELVTARPVGIVRQAGPEPATPTEDARLMGLEAMGDGTSR